MRVTFVDGPLAGREEDIEEDALEEGATIYRPGKDQLEEGDPETPGAEGAVEYVYEGEGRARYVGGRLDQG